MWKTKRKQEEGITNEFLISGIRSGWDLVFTARSLLFFLCDVEASSFSGSLEENRNGKVREESLGRAAMRCTWKGGNLGS